MQFAMKYRLGALAQGDMSTFDQQRGLFASRSDTCQKMIIRLPPEEQGGNLGRISP